MKWNKLSFADNYTALRQEFGYEQAQKFVDCFFPKDLGNLPSSYPYLTREQIRELDRRSIAEYNIPGILLMENAGAGAAEIICRLIRHGPVIIFCGKGNNGGDGFVVARHLHNRGIPVSVCLIGSFSSVAPQTEAGINLAILKHTKIPICEIANSSDSFDIAQISPQTPPELIVDAVFGTGLNSTVQEPFASIFEQLNAWHYPIVALDIPSGLDANTGEILGSAINATLTITFGFPKIGFLRKQGPECTGIVRVVDISIPKELIQF